MAIEELISQPVQTDNATASGGYFDAFVGLADTYISTRFSESARENPEPINHAFNGDTNTIHQPTLGQGPAGETILVKDGTNYKKIGIYTGIGLGSLLVLAVAYKAVK